MWNDNNFACGATVAPDSDNVVTCEFNGLIMALPGYMAGSVIEMMSQAKLFKRDGYSADALMVPAGEELVFKVQGREKFTLPTEREKELAEKLSKKNTDWYNQYVKTQEAEKQLAAANAKLAVLRDVAKCSGTTAAIAATADVVQEGDS